MNEENQVNTSSAEGGDKTIALIAYITFVGLIIAFVMNNEKKDPFAQYHIRQALGIALTSLALMVVNVIPVLGWIVSLLGSLLILIMVIKGILNALNGREEPVPILGRKYLEWLKNI